VVLRASVIPVNTHAILAEREAPFARARRIQFVDVFHTASGPEAAIREAHNRRGTWFDPKLIDALASIGSHDELWDALRSPDLAQIVFGQEPAQFSLTVDDDYLGEIAAAFGQVVDSKSPYMAGHAGAWRSTPI
jgi:hypothetical protein